MSSVELKPEPMTSHLSSPTGAAQPLLVVDDNEVSRHSLKRLLEGQGYAVVTARGGQHALEVLNEQSVDLVVLDIMMQDMNGLDVLRQLREKWPVSDLPVIMATAKDESQDIVEALRLGANDYVTKPLDFPVLLARIQTQLSLKRAMENVLRLEKSLAQRNQDLEAANAKLSAANTHMRHDLEAAARIQEAFLPERRLKFPGVKAAWLYRPCAELAGDTLNAFRLDDTHIGFYIIDVSGHGVAASLLAVTLSHILSPHAETGSFLVRRVEGSDEIHIVPPAEVAERLNHQFTFDETTQQYFTLIYGVLDVETGVVHFVSAGHPGPVYLPAEGPSVLMEEPGLPIGVGSGGYPEYTLRLHPGDRFYLYSDGLVEVMNEQRELLGKARLQQHIEALRSEALDLTVSDLWHEFEKWCGDCPARDDVSVLALEYIGAPVGRSTDTPRLHILKT